MTTRPFSPSHLLPSSTPTTDIPRPSLFNDRTKRHPTIKPNQLSHILFNPYSLCPNDFSDENHGILTQYTTLRKEYNKVEISE
jgi:hypothetical protein